MTGSKKKYELTDNTIEVNGRTLYRIRSLKDFGDVKFGDLGGYVESEDNLSQNGYCWIYTNAEVFGDAEVFDDALVTDLAQVYGRAQVCGDSCVFGNAKVYGDAVVFGEALVYDNARVYDDARVLGNSTIHGDARVYGQTVMFDKKVTGEQVGVTLEIKPTIIMSPLWEGLTSV